MVSRCCQAQVELASSLLMKQLEEDFYQCSQCCKPCDTMALLHSGTNGYEPV